MAIKEAIEKLSRKENLRLEEAQASMDDIMSGATEESVIAAFLMGLRMKGETAEEIAGCALSMRRNAETITTKRKDVIDTCGTGGDGSGTFNVSTTAAIIVSAAGVPVAKHGNRAVSSACGSADVLNALGVNIELEPEQAGKVLDQVGISFLFAPKFHKAMKYAAKVRKSLGIRTVFNVLGPLTNPAGVKRQVVGVFSEEWTEPIASVLSQLGADHSLVVHGSGGLDEFSVFGETRVSEMKGGEVRTYRFHAGDGGIDKGSPEELRGGDSERNAEIIRSILRGKDGAPRAMALLNSGAALYVAGKAPSIREGVALAQDVVDSGAAQKQLESWIEATRSLG